MNKKVWIIVIIVLVALAALVWWMSSRPSTTYAPGAPAAPTAPTLAPEDSAAAIQQELESVNLEDVDGVFQEIDADLNTL